MLFRILYVLFFISSLLYGSFYIGPVTPRQIIAVLMFFFCIKKHYIKLDEFFGPYLIFIVAYLIGNFVCGYLEEPLRYSIGYYFVCFVAYQSTKLLFQEYDGKYIFYILISGLVVLSAVVSIAQMFRMPFSYDLLDILRINVADEVMEKADAHKYDTLIGLTVPGLTGSVANAYLLSLGCALVLFNRQAKIKLYNLPLLLLMLVAVYFAQERTALISSILVSGFIILKLVHSVEEKSRMKKISIYILLLYTIFFLLPIGYDMMVGGTSRYANKGFDLGEDRGTIWTNALSYFFTNPLGSIFDYYEQYHIMPHNVIVNAFIFGGIVGAIAIFVLFYRQFKIIFKIIAENISKDKYLLFLLICAYCVYTLNSMTHNLSIVIGDTICWFLWGAIISMNTIYQCEYNENISNYSGISA